MDKRRNTKKKQGKQKKTKGKGRGGRAQVGANRSAPMLYVVSGQPQPILGEDDAMNVFRNSVNGEGVLLRGGNFRYSRATPRCGRRRNGGQQQGQTPPGHSDELASGQSYEEDEALADYLSNVMMGDSDESDEDDEAAEPARPGLGVPALHKRAVERALFHLDTNQDLGEVMLISSSDDESNDSIDDEFAYDYPYNDSDSDLDAMVVVEPSRNAGRGPTKPLPTPEVLRPPTNGKKLNLQPASLPTTPKNTRQFLKQTSKSTSKKPNKNQRKKAAQKRSSAPKDYKAKQRDAARASQSAQLKADWMGAKSFVRPSDPALGLITELPPPPPKPEPEVAIVVTTSVVDVFVAVPDEEAEDPAVVDETLVVPTLTELVLQTVDEDQRDDESSSDSSEGSYPSDEEVKEEKTPGEPSDDSGEDSTEGNVPWGVTSNPKNDRVFSAILEGDFTQLGSLPHLPQASSRPRSFNDRLQMARVRTSTPPNRQKKQFTTFTPPPPAQYTSRKDKRHNEKTSRKAKQREFNTRLFSRRELLAWDDTFRNFVQSASLNSIPLPAMGRMCRLQLHQLASFYGCYSKSLGTGNKRHALVSKTNHTTQHLKETSLSFINGMLLEEDKVEASSRGPGGKPRPSGGARRGGGGPSPKASTAAARPIEGSQVGANAAPISDTNVGHRLLTAMGWQGGSLRGPLGAGVDAPITAVVKTSKLGLGFDS